MTLSLASTFSDNHTTSHPHDGSHETPPIQKGKGAKAPKKRARESKPYEDKQKTIDSFAFFDTTEAFEQWRESPLVKPWWLLFVRNYLDTELFKKGKKVADFENLYTWILDGERRGKRKFLSQRESPEYGNETDWHAWLTFRLVEENKTDTAGCVFTWSNNKKAMFKTAYHYVLFTKRELARAATRPTSTKSPKGKAAAGPVRKARELSSDEEADMEANLDPTAGVTMVAWSSGAPLELLLSNDAKMSHLVK